MYIQTQHKGQNYQINLASPIDISLPLNDGLENVNCFYAPPVEFIPLIAGDFVGSTEAGSPVNFKNVRLNPHGNGTHTECVGHIAKKKYTIHKSLTSFHFFAKLLSLYPTTTDNGDRVLLPAQIKEVFSKEEAPAIIIRTLPNDHYKRRTNYSGANPPYLHHEAVEYLVECGVQHLLIDLPSVDREEDGGKLLAHRAFWQYPTVIRENATITELIYVPNEIRDGLYFLNIQIASFEMDASPSKPILYELNTI